MTASNNPTTISTPADAKQQFTDEQLQYEVPCLTKDGNKILVKKRMAASERPVQRNGQGFLVKKWKNML